MARARCKKTGSELFIDEGFIRRADVRYTSARRPFEQQLPTDANRSLIALAARSKASGDGEDSRYLTMFYFLNQSMLLNFFEELVDYDARAVRQDAVLDENAAAANGSTHAVGE